MDSLEHRNRISHGFLHVFTTTKKGGSGSNVPLKQSVELKFTTEVDTQVFLGPVHSSEWWLAPDSANGRDSNFVANTEVWILDMQMFCTALPPALGWDVS